jgi:preprotein translocase subunit SecG
MVTLLFTLMIVSGILFIGSVLLMTPKGGLGFGVGGMSTSNEYGSKKSVE